MGVLIFIDRGIVLGKKRNINKSTNRSLQNKPQKQTTKTILKKRVLSIGAFSLLIAFSSALYPPVTDFISGRFGGHLSLGVLNAKVPESEPIYVFFSTPDKEQGVKYLVPVQLTIFNEFKHSEENVSLSLKYHKKNGRASFDEKYMTHSGTRAASEIYHEINSSKTHDYSLYQIDYLPKGGYFSINDTAFTSKVDYTQRFPVLFEMGQELNVEATLYSKGDRQRTWDIRYRAVNVRSGNDLEHWVNQYYGKSIAFELRRQLTFFQYLKRLAFGKNITVYGFEPDFHELTENNIYVPKENVRTYKGFVFNPYLLKLLFDFELTNDK